MNAHDILCPACDAPLRSARCDACATSFAWEPVGDPVGNPNGNPVGGPDGETNGKEARASHLLDHVAGATREARAAEVESFYSVSPFPGYAAEDNAASLLDRSRRSAFLAGLDESLPPDAEVLDLGCGTGQTAMFLALAAPRRRVVGVDGCRVSLELAEDFRRSQDVRNLHLLRADLFDLPLQKERYPFVVCRGVVHHTPDPSLAIAEVAARVAPGGVLVLGFYETWARVFHRARRGLSKLVGRPVQTLDPILRQRDVSDDKKRIWIDDQYHHPLEKILPLPWVLRELRACGLTPERSIPPMPQRHAMFERGETTLGTRTRLEWAASGPRDPDAGLVCVIARRPQNTV